MFPRTTNWLSLLVVYFSLLACTFTPDEENIKAIKPPDPIAFTIEVNDPTFSDPYYMRNSTQFNFTLKDLTKRLTDYEVSIAGNIIANSSGYDLGKSISFNIFAHSLGVGTHTVRISMRIATQSGSLAEKVGAEYHFSEVSFKVIIDNTVPKLSAPVAGAYENGYLTIRWPSPGQRNFNYTIRRIYQSGFGSKDTTFYNPDQTILIDKEYVGGNITYQLLASGFGFDRYELGRVNFTTPPLDLSVAQDEQRIVRLTWSNVKINQTNAYIHSTYKPEKSFPLSDSGTEILDTLALGEERFFWLKIKREGNDDQFYQTVHKVEQKPNLKEYESVVMLADKSKLLICTGLGIYRYSIPEFALEDSVMANQVGVTRFSSMIVNNASSELLAVADRSSIIGIDPLNFNTSVTHYYLDVSARNITGSTDEIRDIWLGNVSDNGLLSLQFRQNTRVAMLFNIQDRSIVWHSLPSELPLGGRAPVVSIDTRYLTYDLFNGSGEAVVYEKIGDTYTKIGFVKSGLKFFIQESNELINTTESSPYNPNDINILVYNLNTTPSDVNAYFTPSRAHTLAARRNLESLVSVHYDPISKRLYHRYMNQGSSALRSIDINTFSESPEIISAFTYVGYTHTISGDYQLTSRGFIEKLR